MRSAAVAAILVACAVAACARDEAEASAAAAAAGAADADYDGYGGHASFMIVLEHADGWRCSGSLLSLRMALTSAWCVRGRGPAPARELWALASAVATPLPSDRPALTSRLQGARRVARVAVAIGADAEVSEASTERNDSWVGGALDLAVAELEQPFGSAAHVVPILMATTAEECRPRAECHVARAVPRPNSRRARMRIVEATLEPPSTCAAAARHWSSVKDRSLCFVGPELCEGDWGAGVVCGGKVCGVLSRSVRGAAPARRGCGHTHAAQSTARWRRFLHCAHTLRACGSGGDCAELCSERVLLEDAPRAPALAPAAPLDLLATKSRHSDHREHDSMPPTRTTAPSMSRAEGAGRRRLGTLSLKHAPAISAAAAAPASPAAPAALAAATPRPAILVTRSLPPESAELPLVSSPLSLEFEPNRADFKAGEYGDNAADYGGEEALTVPTRTSMPESSVSTPNAAATTASAAATAATEPALEQPQAEWHSAAAPAYELPEDGRSATAPTPEQPQAERRSAPDTDALNFMHSAAQRPIAVINNFIYTFVNSFVKNI